MLKGGDQHCEFGSKVLNIQLQKRSHKASFMEAVSSSTIASGSSKRGRTPSRTGSQSVSCVVDGCKSDLSKGRDYHRRHKVCEVHSKTPCVTIRGLQQRFCQQCNRDLLLKKMINVKKKTKIKMKW